MKKEKRQLKLNMKGNLRNYWNVLFLKYKLRKLDVEIVRISDHSFTHVEVVVSGNLDKLWDVINWSKGRDIFIFLDEVVFEFADAAAIR